MPVWRSCARYIKSIIWGNAVESKKGSLERAALSDLFQSGWVHSRHTAGTLLLRGALAPEPIWMGQRRGDFRNPARDSGRSLRTAGFPAVHRAKSQRK